jgi:hypothetical protein
MSEVEIVTKPDKLLVRLWPIDRTRLEQLAADRRTSKAAVIRQLIRDAGERPGRKGER